MNTQLLEQERAIVYAVEQFLKERGPFVSLAEAARLTGVPLPTLSDAVRHGRVPAVQVQPRRWLVRIEAVQSYFQSKEANPHLALQQRLIAEGLLNEIRLEQHFEPFEPLASKGKPASERLIEERREMAQAYFLDSSALVKRYLRERGSICVSTLGANTENLLYIAQVAGVEVISAIARHASLKSISRRKAQTAII